MPDIKDYEELFDDEYKKMRKENEEIKKDILAMKNSAPLMIKRFTDPCEPQCDSKNNPLVMHALYVRHRDNVFQLVRPRSRYARYGSSSMGNGGNEVHCDVIWPHCDGKYDGRIQCYPESLIPADPAKIGRVFQDFVTAIQEYKHEMEHGPPPPPPEKPKLSKMRKERH